MKKVEDECYNLIGQIAIALYPQGIQISLSSLNRIMEDYNHPYESNRGLASAVSAAYRAWEKVDPVVYHAIAYTFTNKHGDLPWDK